MPLGELRELPEASGCSRGQRQGENPLLGFSHPEVQPSFFLMRQDLERLSLMEERKETGGRSVDLASFLLACGRELWLPQLKWA